jgi:hypothetical protein
MKWIFARSLFWLKMIMQLFIFVNLNFNLKKQQHSIDSNENVSLSIN